MTRIQEEAMRANKHSEDLASERTLLAAERTYSAWIRTGLAGVGGGLAVARALVFQSQAHQIAAHLVSGALVILGAAMFVYAIVAYRQTCARLAHAGLANNSIRALGAMTVVLLMVAALIFWITLQ
jgi:putative membrane protein